MHQLTTVIGYGAVGRATVARLIAAGQSVRVVQRNRPADLPASVEFRAADTCNATALTDAVAGSAQIVLAIGFPYSGKVWRECWPATMRNLLAAAEGLNARVVFVDNL